MSVSSENQFYFELGIVYGWSKLPTSAVPLRVQTAIDKLFSYGMGACKGSESWMMEEINALNMEIAEHYD